VWFTAQASGHLGYFDPSSGKSEVIALGPKSAPHGVIQGPDKAAWITDGGQQAIVRVGWPDRSVKTYPLPTGTAYANLNTCVFDGDGDVWFTGQSGYYGKVAVKTGKVQVWDAPRGRGAYGICATPAGEVWFCSLASSYLAHVVDRARGRAEVVDPPTRDQGARRVWSDSKGRIWVSEWVSGNLSMHDPASGQWKVYKPPVDNAHTYAVYVDANDQVWTSEWTQNSVYRFDPASEKFERFALPRPGANIRQIHGRKGEVWLPESGTDHITVIRTA
jgi:virginiamycin B lyase